MLSATIISAALMFSPDPTGDVELLSIKGIPLAEAHRLTEVVIRTWGVEVLAVCHVPKVSIVSVDSDLDPGGILTWKANSWHGELDRPALQTLTNLFLVRASDYQRLPQGSPEGEYHPASFEGSAMIAGTDNEPAHEQTIPLPVESFSLSPATRCPDPH